MTALTFEQEAKVYLANFSLGDEDVSQIIAHIEKSGNFQEYGFSLTASCQSHPRDHMAAFEAILWLGTTSWMKESAPDHPMRQKFEDGVLENLRDIRHSGLGLGSRT